MTNLLNGSAWWRINSKYVDGLGRPASPVIRVAQTATPVIKVPYLTTGGAGKLVHLQDDVDAQRVLRSALSTHVSLPVDPNGIYVIVLSAARMDGACSDWCGYHSFARLPAAEYGGDEAAVVYAVLADLSDCAKTCWAANLTNGNAPSGSAAADAMASVLAHELAEAVTDPAWWRASNGGSPSSSSTSPTTTTSSSSTTSSSELMDYMVSAESIRGGWWDRSSGMENADKCAWQFGATAVDAFGKLYNVALGASKFLLQQNFDPSEGGGCTLNASRSAWPSPPPPAPPPPSPPAGSSGSSLCSGKFIAYCPGVTNARIAPGSSVSVLTAPSPPPGPALRGPAAWVEPFLLLSVRDDNWEPAHCHGNWTWRGTEDTTSTPSSTDVPIWAWTSDSYCEALPVVVTISYTSGAPTVYSLSLGFYGDVETANGE